jgi:hypothetical protein
MRLPGAPRAVNGKQLPYWKRATPSTLVSMVLHVVLGVAAWHAIQVPVVIERFLFDRPEVPAPERVEFVTIVPPQASGPAGQQQDDPGRATPSPARAEPVVPLRAPLEIPTELPPVRLEPAPPAGTGTGTVTGPLRGGSGPTRGVQPGFDDPRVWGPAPEFVYAPKTEKERLDSALVVTLMRHADSLAAATYVPNKFERGDWTVERGGQKWGIDQQFIRLGPVSIPTALLALLPMNQMQPNPIEWERSRNNAWMRADILYHAQAAMNEDQFRQAVRAIRDRRERERRQSRVPPTSPGPLTSPGERPPER